MMLYVFSPGSMPAVLRLILISAVSFGPKTPEEIETIDQQIASEREAGQVDPDAGTNLGGPEGGFGDPTRGVEQEPLYPEDEYPDADEPTNGNGNGNGRNGNGGQENRNL